MNKAIYGRDMIKRVKPLLSDQPIKKIDMSVPCNDVVTLTVTYLPTEELIAAMTNKKPSKDSMPTSSSSDQSPIVINGKCDVGINEFIDILEQMAKGVSIYG